MATPNKGYVIQNFGDNSGTWGTVLNNEMITYVDYNLGGLKSQGLSNVNVTLSATDSRNVIYRLTGALSANVYIALDVSGSNGFLIVENLTTGNNTVSIRNAYYSNPSYPNNVQATVPQSALCLLITDTNYGVRLVSQTGVNTFSGGTTGLTPSTATNGTVTLGGQLNVANGGTGLTTLTANNVILGNGTSAPNFVAPGTSANVLTSNGTTWTSAAIPLATQSGMEAETSTTTYVTPSVVKYGPGVCKAWGLINLSGGLTYGYNLTSVRTSTGRYTITLNPAMSSTNYAVLATVAEAPGSVRTLSTNSKTNSTFQISITRSDGSAGDEAFQVCVFGDLP